MTKCNKYYQKDNILSKRSIFLGYFEGDDSKKAGRSIAGIIYSYLRFIF